MPHHIKTIRSDVVQSGKCMLELRLDRVAAAGAEPFNESIATAMPLPIDGDGIVEFRGTDFWKEARIEDVGHEFVAGRNDLHLLDFGRKYANSFRRPNPPSLAHGAFPHEQSS